MNRLLPCPFCGGNVEILVCNRGASVRCEKCSAETKFRDLEIEYCMGQGESQDTHMKKVTMAWNRRVFIEDGFKSITPRLKPGALKSPD